MTSSVTKEEDPCLRCDGTERYISNNRCVSCAKELAVKNVKKARDKVTKNWGASSNGGMPRPDKPDRKEWPGQKNVDGDRIYVDPIVYLGLGDAGSFE